MECPFCKEDIKDGAIKCKHCGSMLNERDDHVAPEEKKENDKSDIDESRRHVQNYDLRSNYKQSKKTVIPFKTIITISLIMGLVAFCSKLGKNDNVKSMTNTSSSSSTKTEYSRNEKTDVEYAVGEYVNTDKFSVQVESVRYGRSIGSGFIESRASSGAIYVAVKWSYKNITNEPISSYKTPSIYLISPDGVKYKPDVGATISYASALEIDAKVVSDINPNIKVNDADVFEVSEELLKKGNWYLYIDSDQDIYISIDVSRNNKSNASSNQNESTLNDSQAADLFIERVKSSNMYRINCISMSREETSDEYVDFVIREKHDAECGGDPDTSPVIDRYRVNKRDGKVLRLDSNGEYK